MAAEPMDIDGDVKRKGRGFSSAEQASTGFPTISSFDTLPEEGTAIEGWVVFVTGLNEETTEDDLRDRFGEYGRVRDVRLNLDHRTGYVKGYALVEYDRFAEAKVAVENATGSVFMETTIECGFAFKRPPPVEGASSFSM